MYHIIDSATFLDLGNHTFNGMYFRYLSATYAYRDMHGMNDIEGYPRYFVVYK